MTCFRRQYYLATFLLCAVGCGNSPKNIRPNIPHLVVNTPVKTASQKNEDETPQLPPIFTVKLINPKLINEYYEIRVTPAWIENSSLSLGFAGWFNAMHYNIDGSPYAPPLADQPAVIAPRQFIAAKTIAKNYSPKLIREKTPSFSAVKKISSLNFEGGMFIIKVNDPGFNDVPFGAGGLIKTSVQSCLNGDTQSAEEKLGAFALGL